MKIVAAFLMVVIFGGCASIPQAPPPADMKNEPAGSLGYNCYYNQRCPNYDWGVAADYQHKNNYAVKIAEETEQPQPIIQGPKSGKCISSYPLSCVVTQKLDDHHLGLACSNAYIESHAILEVTQIRNYKIGPMNTGFQYLSTKTMKLDNGFDAAVDLWKECAWGPSN